MHRVRGDGVSAWRPQRRRCGDLTDAVLLSRSLTDLVKLTAEQQKAADINGDGVITSADAVILVRFLAELIPSLR